MGTGGFILRRKKPGRSSEQVSDSRMKTGRLKNIQRVKLINLFNLLKI